jgi:iron complex transport system substrate-binding protein
MLFPWACISLNRLSGISLFGCPTWTGVALIATFLLGCQREAANRRLDTPASSPKTAQADSASQINQLGCVEPALRWALRFQFRCGSGRLTITMKEPWRNAGQAFTYVLVPGSEALPPPKDDTTWLHPQPNRIAALIGAQIGFLDALGDINRVAAISKKAYVFHPILREKMAMGTLMEVGDIGQAQAEALAQGGIQAIWHAGNGGDALNSSLRWHRLGVTLVQGGEWMEPHPLGRAEWIKFYAALLDKSSLAESLFVRIEQAYVKKRDSLQASGTGPTALIGGPWQGIWHVPGGRSYPAQLARDAGLRYLWSDDSSEGSLPLSPEIVLSRGQTADLWLNPGDVPDIATLLRQDGRYSRLAAVRARRVYNSDKRLAAEGGNDYWESGVVHPEWLLQDLASLASGDTSELRYWRRLP